MTRIQPKSASTIAHRTLPVILNAILGIIFLSVVLTGCAYRFTNSHVARPPGMRTIAFEAIYDTSREVMPHEIIWEAMQRAFASDGHLRVVSKSQADLLMRVHLRQASVTPSGLQESGPLKDPEVYVGMPPLPQNFKRLTVAREYALKEFVNLAMDVEIWQLSTGKLVLSKTYTGAREFFSVRDPSIDITYHYLRHEEALNNQVDIIATGAASAVVSDFLIAQESLQSASID